MAEPMFKTRSTLAILAGLVWLTACRHPTESDCVHVPCPLPSAIMLTVTSAAGGPVPDLTLTVAGSVSSTGPCSVGPSAASCFVLGTAGTYDLQLTAPGFQNKTLSVTVAGTSPACGCPSVQTQHVDVVLTPK